MNKQIQKFKSLLLIIFISSFFSACSFSDPTYTLKLSSKDLQKNMEENFPIKRSVMFGSVSMVDPKIKLKEDSNRINTGLTFVYAAPFFTAQRGHIEISGKIYYKSNNKAFYVLNPKVEEMKYKDAAMSKMIPEPLVEMMSKMISEIFSQYAIYEVKGNSLKAKIFEKTLRKAEVKDGQLQLTFGIP